jgi:hypothetical protein
MRDFSGSMINIITQRTQKNLIKYEVFFLDFIYFFKEISKTVDAVSPVFDLVISSTLPFILDAQSFAHLNPSAISLV